MENKIFNRYGRLILISPHKLATGRRGYLFLCDCGELVVKSHMILVRETGGVEGCGCSNGAGHKHGLSKKRVYKTWKSMRGRCFNKSNQDYKYYGGRGITTCSEWDSPVLFCAWALNHGYADNLTLERNNVNENYCPENCCWIPMSDQSRNRRVSLNYEFSGCSGNTAFWAEKTGIKESTIRARLTILGWPIERALSKKVRRKLTA